MSSYLIKTGDDPFTAESIRTELGLDTKGCDRLIDMIITQRTLVTGRVIRTEVWEVAEGSDPSRFGDAALVSEPHTLPSDKSGRLYRTYEFVPTAEDIATARKQVVVRCRKDPDIGRALAMEQEARDFDAQRAVEGRVEQAEAA